MIQPSLEKDNFKELFSISHKSDIRIEFDIMHFHDGYEIHYTKSGQADFFINSKQYKSKEGTISIISPYEVHRIITNPDSKYERYVVYFKPGFIHSVTDEYPELLLLFKNRPIDFENCLQMDYQSQSDLLSLLNHLCFLNEDKPHFLQELQIKQTLIDILIFLNKAFMKANNFCTPVLNKQNELLNTIISFFKEHTDESLTLDDISARFFISKSTLIRLFKDTLGITPIQFLINIRLVKAKELLNSGYSVQETSELVGYKDEYNFIKLFKKNYNISPKQYANRNKI